jgi:hypothetical protein
METTNETPRFNYTQNAWEGSNYRANQNLSITEIAKLVRAKLKEQYPACKFSVTVEKYSGGCSMSVALMAAPFAAIATPDADKIPSKDLTWGTEQAIKSWQYCVDRQYHQVNQYYINDSYYMTDEAKEVMQAVNNFANSFNFDDSDGMIDYFHTNFYLHLAIGKWNKPFIKTN